MASKATEKMVKIPDMFLRAAKRKSDVASSDISTKVDAKRGKETAEEEVENKENGKTDGAVAKKIAKMSPETGDFSLLNLLKCESWKSLLNDEFSKPYMNKIEQFLSKEYAKGTTIFPPREEIFTAFNLTPLQDIRVVVIGQDPYHNDGQAHGLSFSVKKGIRAPPSLVNIYKELVVDIEGFKRPDHGFLEGWSRQGVFLLNATLTVKAHEANSHAAIGWQRFTDEVISRISKDSTESVVFLLWGGFAHKKESLVDKKKHIVIKTAHPSPLSARKWFGCRCFSKCNEALVNAGREPINWSDLY